MWAKFDKRAGHKVYKGGRVCAGQRVLVIGAGPCGLRTAIEAQFLGARHVLMMHNLPCLTPQFGKKCPLLYVPNFIHKSIILDLYRVVVVEKRDRFSRNNVLHLWPYNIHDLRGLAAKKFCGKFCAGSIDHVSIRQLQCILLKVTQNTG